jgi:hypothetical protein
MTSRERNFEDAARVMNDSLTMRAITSVGRAVNTPPQPSSA